MTVKFDWVDAEKTIGRYELGEDWTWEEVQQVMAESWEQISKIDSIVDSMLVSKNGSLPPNALAQFRSMAQNRPANTGMLVLVGPSNFQRSIIQIFKMVYSSTLRREIPILFANTVEEAHTMLLKLKAERDASKK